VDGSIECTLNLSNTKIDKVLSIDSNLSISMFRSTSRDDALHLRFVIVIVVGGSRGPKSIFKGNLDRNRSWFEVRRNITLNIVV